MKFYRLPGATFYDCITIIYQFIKTFLDNKMSILRNMEPLTIGSLTIYGCEADLNLR